MFLFLPAKVDKDPLTNLDTYFAHSDRHTYSIIYPTYDLATLTLTLTPWKPIKCLVKHVQVTKLYNYPQNYLKKIEIIFALIEMNCDLGHLC